MELKNLQKFFESEKVENATLKACLQEKLNQEERYKNTIVNLQEIYAEQIRKKGEEHEKEVLKLREYIGELKLAHKQESNKRKRKKRYATSSSSSSSSSSSESEANAKKIRLSENRQEQEEAETYPGSPKEVADGENTNASFIEELQATEAVPVPVPEEHEELV